MFFGDPHALLREACVAAAHRRAHKHCDCLRVRRSTVAYFRPHVGVGPALLSRIRRRFLRAGIARSNVRTEAGNSFGRPVSGTIPFEATLCYDPSGLQGEAMTRSRYFVVQHGDVWMIKFDDEEYGPYKSKNEAMLFAIDAAQKLGEHGENADVVLMGEDNHVRPEWVYGRDPYPPRLSGL
jgi:hypothetical protein